MNKRDLKHHHKSHMKVAVDIDKVINKILLQLLDHFLKEKTIKLGENHKKIK